MPRLARALCLLTALALLAACGTPGPPKRVWPPQASLQELSVQADGSWRLGVRLHNFSTVPMTFESAELDLTIGGQAAGRVLLTPRMRIGPSSAEILTLQLPPEFEAAGLVADALQTRSGLRYRLAGSIVTSDPSGTHRSEFDSVLSPVPGLPGVLR
jgi:hypothetical protein